MEPQGRRRISAFRVTKQSTKLRRLSKTTRSRVHVQTVGLNAETKKVSAPSRRGRMSLDIPFYRTSPVTAFYKGESQEKNFPGDWKEQRFLSGSPAHVMLGGSWGSLFSPIHVAVVTTPVVSDATSSAVAKMPTIVLSEARSL